MELNYKLFEAGRLKYENEKSKEPFFVSDWDIDCLLTYSPVPIIEKSFVDSLNKVHEYSFIEDQNWIKNHIKYDSEKHVRISPEFTLAPNGTAGLFLTLSHLSKNKQRFLLLIPSYYSIIDTLEQLGQTYIYFSIHNDDFNDLLMDKIEREIKVQKITSLVITDPIYCFGKSVSSEFIQSLASICNKYNCWLVMDHNLGGLEWDSPQIVPIEKINAISKAEKFCFIDSLPKRLLVNGLKFTVVYGSKELIKGIEDLSSQITGGFTSQQLHFAKELHLVENQELVLKMLNSNIQNIERNYQLLKSALIGSSLSLSAADSGYFCALEHQDFTFDEVNEYETFKKFLFDYDLLLLPTSYFTSAREGKYSVRINLMKDFRPILHKLLEAVNNDFNFIKR